MATDDPLLLKRIVLNALIGAESESVRALDEVIAALM
jgi:hypothetical protein